MLDDKLVQYIQLIDYMYARVYITFVCLLSSFVSCNLLSFDLSSQVVFGYFVSAYVFFNKLNLGSSNSPTVD